MKTTENGIQSLFKTFVLLILGFFMMTTPVDAKDQLATFAGGCFWCTQAAFDNINGVKEVFSGYTGGHILNPTYEQVCSGKSGHVEAIQIRFDPAKTTFEALLQVFWNNIDPTDAGGQYADRGHQYITVVYYHTEKQKQIAEQSKKNLEKKLGQPVKTLILPAAAFYKAEDYHQNYHLKNPLRYNMYKHGSGRPEK